MCRGFARARERCFSGGAVSPSKAEKLSASGVGDGVSQELLKQFGISSLPTHPITDEELICTGVATETEIRELTFGPPRMPTRTVFEYDEDGEIVGSCELDDREYALAMADYNAAARRWSETGGREVYPGRTTVTGKFRTKAGSTAEGVWDGGKWLLSRWSWIHGSDPRLEETKGRGRHES